MSGAYYNEHDPFAAQWLRNLIAAGHIARGEVDERDIRDVDPDDLRGFTQCHFFAGIGGWSLALRLAGWSDDRPVWTGSCPCQSFSAAGKGMGSRDERHLWPKWRSLIEVRRPVRVYGEQVASQDGLAWLDIVCADLEAARYASGAVDLCAAGVGAPHIRQRLWIVADANGGNASTEGLQRRRQHGQQPEDCRTGRGSMADAADADRRGGECGTETGTRPDGEWRRRLAGGGVAGNMADASVARSQGDADRSADSQCATAERSRTVGSMADTEHDGGRTDVARRGSERRETNGRADPWRCEWIDCTDGKARPVEPGTFPLAYGLSGRVGRLRAYGNAIVPQLAALVVEVGDEIFGTEGMMQ